MATPYPVRVLEEVASTQDTARQAAVEEGVPIVIVAHRQTAGRGRTGARWDTAPRAFAVSVAFHPPLSSPLSLVAGVAARRTIGEAVALKWPNDLLLGDDKVGGILVEGSGDLVVAGLGVNLFWPSPPPGVTAIFENDPGPDVGPSLATEWASVLLGLAADPDWPRTEYMAACVTLGTDVEWDPDGRGRALDIAQDGSLVVLTAAGEQRLASGAVRHIRGMSL